MHASMSQARLGTLHVGSEQRDLADIHGDFGIMICDVEVSGWIVHRGMLFVAGGLGV